jgi:hypothetical protein
MFIYIENNLTIIGNNNLKNTTIKNNLNINSDIVNITNDIYIGNELTVNGTTAARDSCYFIQKVHYVQSSSINT